MRVVVYVVKETTDR